MAETNNTSLSGLTVLQVIPELDTGGAERTTIDIARALTEAGGKALVASRGGKMEEELEMAGGLLIRLPAQSKNPFIMLINAWRLRKIIRQHDVNIVHARSRAPAWSALWAAKMTGAVFITTYHGTYQAKSVFKRFYNSVMARGVRVIANSAFIADSIAREHGVERSRIRVVHRGADLSRFDPAVVDPGRVDNLRVAWGIADSGPVILLPGRLTRWKGQEVFVEAMSELRKLGLHDFHAVMIGDAQGRDEYVAGLVSSIRMRGLSSHVQIAENCWDWPAAYAFADVVVSASIEPEAFGRVAVEAQAMQKPIIATDHGGSLETVIVGEGATGWRVTPGDPKALAVAVKDALELSPASRQEIGGRGRANAEAQFSQQAMCAKTLDIYRELQGT